MLATRSDPSFALARYRARNRLLKIRGQDLRFNVDEATTFLSATAGLQLSAEDVAALEARTEGWIAGLQLAAIALQTPAAGQDRADPSAFIHSFAGSHVYVAGYLLEEVLRRQPQVIQSFLMQTSILQRLGGDLCDAVTGGEDGRATLAALQRTNSFIIPLDDEGNWFRYHHLFADLLRRAPPSSPCSTPWSYAARRPIPSKISRTSCSTLSAPTRRLPYRASLMPWWKP